MEVPHDVIKQGKANTLPPSIGKRTAEVLNDLGSVFPEKKQKKIKKEGEKKKIKHWTKFENEIYISFLEKEGYKLSESVDEKRKTRPHYHMSKKVGSKDPRQCRSHHQKMINRHHTIDKIIDFFTSKKEKVPFIPEDESFTEESPASSHFEEASIFNMGVEPKRDKGLQDIAKMMEVSHSFIGHPEDIDCFFRKE